jgi:uncharacterized damage-inducible protein DinB
MTSISGILLKQTDDAYQWTRRLIDDIPFDKWDILAAGTASTLTWQVGHLLVSSYYHSVWVVAGHQMDVLQQIPMKQYGSLFTQDSPDKAVGIVKPTDVRQHLDTMYDKSLAIISKLSDEALNDALDPTPVPHPIAKTKYEAIDWNVKHTMYHCGQIGVLRRIVDKRFDFGLRV